MELHQTMAPTVITTTELLVLGMKTNACRQAVCEVLEEVPGVRDVDVNLFRALATIRHTSACRPEDLVRAVATRGYLATPAQR